MADCGATTDLKHLYENLILIDGAANLVHKKYSRDQESVIQRAKDAGVQKIMVNGTSVKGSKEALRLTRIYPGIVYSTAGIHPHDSKSIVEDPDSWLDFCAIARSPECVAIGPCGLDYQRDFSEPETQKEVFEKQIRLACELEKPILIHERSAQDDVLEIIKKFQIDNQIIVKGFMGTQDEAIKYLDRGFYLGLTGYLCKVSKRLQSPDQTIVTLGSDMSHYHF